MAFAEYLRTSDVSENGKVYWVYLKPLTNRLPSTDHLPTDQRTCDHQCVYPNSHSFFFYSRIQNFTVVPKQPFVILQRNTKFYSCTQTTIRFFIEKYKILKLYPSGYFVFSQRNTKF